jgi:hypothetical protein
MLASLAAAPAASATSYELALVRGFAKPEDVELVPTRGLLLVSEMGADAPSSGGALSAVAWSRERGLYGMPRRLWPSDEALAPARSMGDPACEAPPDPAAFSGHGLAAAADEASTLVAIVGHGAREAIELFRIEGAGEDARARWIGCVPLPPWTAGNDVVVAPDGALLVTNYSPTVHGLVAWAWLQLAALGWNTGSVLGWTSAGGWQELPHSAGAMPNGIARAGARTVVAYNGAHALAVLPGTEGAPAAEVRRIALPGGPDNVSARPDGTILAAVLHGSPPGAWTIVSVDLERASVESVFVHDGSRLPAVTAAVSDGRRLFLGSMLGDAIGVLEPVVPR